MQRLAIWMLSAILAVVGVVLLVGGAILIGEGGSPYYAIAGLISAGTAIALFRRSAIALKLYGALLAGTFVWSLWEAGLDGWALAPRLLGPASLGLFLIAVPAKWYSTPPSRWFSGGPALACLGAVALAGIFAVLPDYTENSEVSSAQAMEQDSAEATEWLNWGNTPEGTRYVPASQINTGNVDKLELAWRYDSDLPPPLYPNFEVTPLMADGRLYACLKAGVVVALDPETGKEIWRYTTPDLEKFDFLRVFGAKCRGVSYYAAPEAEGLCAKRLIFPTPDGYLRAIDIVTGQPCLGFGRDGAVDLQQGMESQLPPSRFNVEAIPSSPPAIINGVAIVGQTVSDLASLDAPSGVIRGYDAVSGELLWAWNAGMEDGDDGTYARATPNA